MNARVLLLLVLSPNIGYAATVDFCILHTGEYIDNGPEEAIAHDYWTDDNPKYARGALVEIYRGSTSIYYGYLGDGLGGGTGSLGCTGPITVSSVNATYTVLRPKFGSGERQLRLREGRVHGCQHSRRRDHGRHERAV